MEQRKLMQHGISSLTLALPMKWIKDRGLKKGDSLYVDIEGNKLILGTEKSLQIERISVDITGLDRSSIILYLESLYRFGYNEVEVRFNDKTAHFYRENKKINISTLLHWIVNRCMGWEIVDQTENKIIIKYLMKEASEDFKTILRRIFRLLNEAAENLIGGIKDNDKTRITTVEEHDNITKFVSYCLRLLNKYGHPDVKKTCLYYHVIASLDKIIDIMKYNARDILNYNKNFNKLTINIWEDINKSLKDYYNLFYNFDLDLVKKLSKSRDDTRKKIKDNAKKIPAEELIFITSMYQIMEIILDLMEFRMGLEY